jgi:GntR family transcriptional regulator/MocR family aminotransferase
MDRTSRKPELLVPLTRGATPMHAQIGQALRQAIREGRLPAGTGVPSTRTLAGDLGVSRGVVVEAYEQLIAEGYLVTTPASETRVTGSVRGVVPEHVCPEPRVFELDFRPGHPDLRSFPWEAWRRSSRSALRLAAGQLGYGDPRGTLELRTALADYLSRARGVAGAWSRLIVCTGCAQGLSIAARALRTRGVVTRIALEDPGHPDIRRIVGEAGLVPVPVPVDEDGLQVDELERARVRAVLVSPAHQNPMGGVLTPSRRQQLLEWASRTRGFIVEDDYDAEYRYDRTAVGALQGLAPERVLYVGSASKILAPGLRLGWLLLQGPLLETAVEVKRYLDNGSPVIEQLTYAQFVRSGELDRHLRRMRRRYRSRRDTLLKALSRYCPGWTVHGAAAGLHLVAEPPADVDVRLVVERAEERSVRVYPLADYAFHRLPRPGLVFGYGWLSESEIEDAVRRIGEGLRPPTIRRGRSLARAPYQTAPRSRARGCG